MIWFAVLLIAAFVLFTVVAFLSGILEGALHRAARKRERG